MSSNAATVVLAHGAWADGSSWAKVIGSLAAEGIEVVAAPLPLTSFSDDVAALERTLARVTGPVVLAGHAYAGAVIGATRNEKVRALVYVAALAPDEGETVADLFYRTAPHPQAPMLTPDEQGIIYLPEAAFAAAFAQHAAAEEQTLLAAVQRPISTACITVAVDRPLWKDRPVLVSRRGGGPHDCSGKPALHGGANAGARAIAPGRPYPHRHRARRRRGNHS